MSFLRRIAGIVSGIIDELTDQNAYRRHLAWHGTQPSDAEWRKFCDQRWKAKSQRGTCC